MSANQAASSQASAASRGIVYEGRLVQADESLFDYPQQNNGLPREECAFVGGAEPLQLNGERFQCSTLPGGGVRLRSDSGTFHQVDYDHWMKVSQAREQSRSVYRAPQNDVAHRLSGAQLVDKDGRVHEVQKVYSSWFMGSYVSALLKCGDSHSTAIVENISSISPMVRIGEESFRARFGHV